MANFAAFVKDKETGKWLYLEREYESAKAFKNDLVGNGYAVRICCLAEKYEETCARWHESNDLNKAIKRAQRESEKRLRESREKISKMTEEEREAYFAEISAKIKARAAK